MDTNKKVFLSILAQILYFITNIVVTFFLTPFIIKKLGDFNYGFWILISTIVGYFAYSEFGVGSAIQNQLSIQLGQNNMEKYRGIFSSGFFLYILVSIIVFLLTIIASLIGLHLKNSGMDPLILAIILFIYGTNLALSFIFYPYTSVLISYIRLDILAWVAIFQTIFSALLSVIVLNLEFGLVMLALVGLITTIITNSFIFLYAKRLVPKLRFEKDKIEKDKIKDIFVFGGKTFFIQLSDLLRFKLDEVVTGVFISVKLVTHYSISNKMVTTSNGVILKLLSILNPLFAQQLGDGDGKKIGETFFFTLKVIGVFSIFIYIILIFLGSPFILLWLGKKYLDAYIPLILLGGAYCIGKFQSPSINLFYATNKHHFYGYMNVAEGVLNLGFSLLFAIYFKMGINGIALGTLIPIIISKIFVQPFLVSSCIKIDVKEMYISMLRIFTIAIFIYGPYYLFRLYFHINSYVDIFISFMLLSVSSIFHLFFVLNKKEKEIIFSLIKSAFKVA